MINTAAEPSAILRASGSTLSELSDQICTASVSAGRIGLQGLLLCRGFQLAKLRLGVEMPAVKINAAASPKMRPAARMKPVTRLGIAAGISTLRIVSHLP